MRRSGLEGDGARWAVDPRTSERVDDAAGFRSVVSEDGRGAVRSSSSGSASRIPQRGLEDEGRRALPGGRQRSSGAGAPDGLFERAAGRELRDGRPRFDAAIEPGGYQWFYLDGVSDDRRHAIVIIAMLGNPFSPRYARARRRGFADPLAFCATNVALYGPKRSLWALTERTVTAREAAGLSIGPSSMRWDRDRLVLDVSERTPWRQEPIEGRITFAPHFLSRDTFALDSDGKHEWRPVAPSGALDVQLSSPRVSFQATGYHDSNSGDVPLEASFEEWTWSRAHAAGRTVVTYDVVLAGGGRRERALSIGPRGTTDVDVAIRSLPPSRWGLSRQARSGEAPRIVRSLEDTPFYSRDLIDDGGVVAMHETLSLNRFAGRAVQFLLPFRMRHA